jgi:hypothetical protein
MKLPQQVSPVPTNTSVGTILGAMARIYPSECTCRGRMPQQTKGEQTLGVPFSQSTFGCPPGTTAYCYGDRGDECRCTGWHSVGAPGGSPPIVNQPIGYIGRG